MSEDTPLILYWSMDRIDPALSNVFCFGSRCWQIKCKWLMFNLMDLLSWVLDPEDQHYGQGQIIGSGLTLVCPWLPPQVLLLTVKYQVLLAMESPPLSPIQTNLDRVHSHCPHSWIPLLHPAALLPIFHSLGFFLLFHEVCFQYFLHWGNGSSFIEFVSDYLRFS